MSVWEVLRHNFLSHEQNDLRVLAKDKIVDVIKKVNKEKELSAELDTLLK